MRRAVFLMGLLFGTTAVFPRFAALAQEASPVRRSAFLMPVGPHLRF